MNALRKVSFWLIAGLLASGFAARAFGHEAKIVRVTGTATVVLPDGTSTPAVKGVMVPQGATITTSASSQVFLEVFSGGIATIAENTTIGVEKLALEKSGDTVTSQEALLDLKKGSVISTLDPTKKAINHYGVRTPKGVAAARGTVYSVTVGEDQYTVETTLSGAVVITNTTTGTAVTVSSGGTSVNGGDALTGDQVAADSALNAVVTRSVAIAAAALAQVQNNTDGDFSSDQAATASGELSTLQQTVRDSLPQASNAVQTAVETGQVPAAQPSTGGSQPQNQNPTQTPLTPVDVSQVSASHN
jgi:hypothetical protein